MTRVLIWLADALRRYHIRKDNLGFGGVEFGNPKRQVGLDVGRGGGSL